MTKSLLVPAPRIFKDTALEQKPVEEEFSLALSKILHTFLIIVDRGEGSVDPYCMAMEIAITTPTMARKKSVVLPLM
jgi:hypothetical protein